MKVHYYLLLFLITLIFIPGTAQKLSDEEKTTLSAIDQFMSGKYPASNPGAALLVVKDGKTMLRKGYGKAALSPDSDIRPDMVFRIGSITKQFTSVAILKLAKEGKIRLQDEITTYLPAYPTNGKKITIEHLLTHTSGIKSYTSIPEVMSARGTATTPDSLINTFKDKPMDFSPGEEFLYNNSGYFLLGKIIETVTGGSYEEYVRKNFFIPLRMKSTVYDDGKVEKDKKAIGYGRGKDGVEVAAFVHPSVPYSAGTLASTVDDLWKWNETIFSYKVLPEDVIAKAWEPYTLNSGIKGNYGYGWSLGRIGEWKVIEHGGGIDGYLSQALYIPGQKLFVCILSNNATIAPGPQANHIARLMLGQLVNDPPAIAMDEKSLNEYTGVYQISEKEERIITRDGNQLFFERRGGNRTEVFAYEKDAFFIKGSPGRLYFHRDANGKIKSVEFAGSEWVSTSAVRTDKPAPAPRVAIDLDPVKFDPFVGEYEIGPSFILKIWREDRSYKAQASGQDTFEIFPESEKKFFLKAFDGQLEFNKDDSGSVTGVTMYQGGRATLAKKIK